MRIPLTQLTQHLQGQLAPLYTVFGDEPLLVIEATDLIRAKTQKIGYTKSEIFIVNQHFNWSDLRQSSTNLSLFHEQRFIDIRISSGKPGNTGSIAIEEYCDSLPIDTVTLVTLPKIEKQSQAGRWFKALENTGIMISVPLVTRTELPAWINRRLSAQEQKITLETLQFLTDKVEGNLLAAHQEIRKLALLYPSGTLSFTQVKDAVLDVARYDVYKLSDAMMGANTLRYVKILDELKGEGIVAPLILTVITAQIRLLIGIRKGINSGKLITQLMKEAKVWGERQKIIESTAKRLGLKTLVMALLHAAKIDKINKCVLRGDAWDELLQLGLRFMNSKHL